MTEHNENESSSIPGYMSTKQAARLLGISNHRLYQYVKAGRLPVVHVGKAFMLRVEDVEGFKPNPSGRMRRKGASWREYKSRSTMFALDISVPVRPGQQVPLVEKFRAVRQADQHTFSGTIARYMIKGDDAFTTLRMMLIWKDIEMPAETIRQKDLQAFQEAFYEVLDWEKAEYRLNEILLHT